MRSAASASLESVETMARPAKKNGTASTRKRIASASVARHSRPSPAGSRGIQAMQASARTEPSQNAAPEAAPTTCREAACTRLLRIATTPLTPKPSRATLIDRKAKWYQSTNEKIRVSPISRTRVAAEMRNTPAPADQTPAASLPPPTTEPLPLITSVIAETRAGERQPGSPPRARSPAAGDHCTLTRQSGPAVAAGCRQRV